MVTIQLRVSCYYSDILVFLTGQEEIESCQQILMKCNNGLPAGMTYLLSSMMHSVCSAVRLPEAKCVQAVCSPAHCTAAACVCR